MATDDHYKEELKKIGKLVDIYDTTPHSQNTALDVVLSGKMLTCSSRNIVITCIADGRRLGFIDDCDIYALFGNILDNAIEAVEHVTDPGKRMISLQISTQDDFLLIEEENYFAGPLKYENGLPITTKEDRTNHGFGMQSIQILTEKYDGLLKISTEDDVFSLSILIPIPASA
jgi:sensor histidine kinase regulating citrate/malate metabolism